MTDKDFTLTQKYLKECLHYNPETGEFTWLHRPESHFGLKRIQKMWNIQNHGRRAGNIRKDNSGKRYRRISIKNKTYEEHSLAFLYVTGNYPINISDHKDGNGLNNKWENLRDIINKDNYKNTRHRSNNTTGTMGVYLNKIINKWYAQINVNGKNKHLGMFENFPDAKKARMDAQKKYGYHKNHGSVRAL